VLGKTIRPPLFRRLWQRNQQCRLTERQMPWLLAEINERSRANTFDIAPIGREPKIERKNLILVQRVFDF